MSFTLKARQLKTQLFCLSTAGVLLSACGGGGNDASQPSSPSPVAGSDSISWTQNHFEPQENFKDLCEAPRSGTKYPDKQGSALAEKYWLRSWNNETYLWYSEVSDQDPKNFGPPQQYFLRALKTNERTASGNPKDKFHFLINSADYEASQSGINAGYGIEWKVTGSLKETPRKVEVAFSEPGSPADLAGLPRGALLLEIDGVDFINTDSGNGLAILQEGLFPTTLGKEHRFKFKEISGEERVLTMTPSKVTTHPVHNVKTIETETGKVGYMQFNTHIGVAQEPLIDAINTFKAEGISDLVLDLRYNGGGSLALASQLSYMIAGPEATQDKTFEVTQYNDKLSNEHSNPVPFYNKKIDYDKGEFTDERLPSINLNRLFVLTTENTCSASEAIMNGLRGIDVEVIQIGDTTCGKPYGFIPTDNCGTTYFTVQFQGVNHKGFGDYGDGFTPVNTTGSIGREVTGCSVADDLTKDLGDIEEAQLAAALNYRMNEECPTPTGKGMKFVQEFETESKATGLINKKPFASTNRILQDIR